jgi:hypothetical protein
MERWLAIILSGMFVYWLLTNNPQRSARVATWLLWLILMLPPFYTVAYMEVYKIAPPWYYTAISWLSCAGLYWWLSLPLVPKAETPEESVESVALPVLTPQPLESAEEDELKACFPWSVYFLDSIEYRSQGVVCRGKLRTEPQVAYETIQQNIKERFENRFYVLFQSGFGDRPFFLLVPNVGQGRNLQKPRPVYYFLATTSWVLAWAIACYMGALLMGVEPAAHGWPYALTLLGALGARDISRWLVARYHKIRTGLLYFIPLPIFPGTCGTLMQLQDPIPQRRSLFDLGLAGALSSLVVSLAGLGWGLAHSPVVSLTAQSGILQFDSCNPRFSLVLTLLSKLAIGKDFQAETAIDLHPVAIAAYLGFLLTAINLLPFKRFDGGNIVHAMYGVRGSVIIGQVVKALLLVLGFLQLNFTGHNGALLFALLLSFFPTVSDPTLNDVSEINSGRDILGLGLLAIAVLVFLPVGGVMASWLGV